MAFRSRVSDPFELSEQLLEDGDLLGVRDAIPGDAQQSRTAERLGFESIWVTQLPDARDAAIVLAAYAAATKTVTLGTGVLPIYTRHPTAMAQMAASLDELSHGRFILGIGVSHRVTVEAMWGLKLHRPVQAMREYLTILRSSLREGSVAFDGEQFTARWAYSGPRRAGLQKLYVNNELQ